MEFIPSGTRIDFVGKRRLAAIVSGLMVLASIVLFFTKGPNWGIDFTGGTEVRMHFDQAVEIDQVRTALERVGVAADAVQQIGRQSENAYVVRIQDPSFGTTGVKEQVDAALAQAFGPEWLEESRLDAQVALKVTVRYRGEDLPEATIQSAVAGIEGAKVQASPDENTAFIVLPGLSSRIGDAVRGAFGDQKVTIDQVDSVGPKVGGDLREKGMLAIFVTLGLILVYVALRFDIGFAPGAVIALFHDVTVVMGIFIILGREFNLSIIGAMLTIIGYSLNDTIVVYDRIRENLKRYRRRDMGALINESVNETLSRTVNTALTTIMSITAFLFLGGEVIADFALAILLGVFFGTYSTVYVASPTILLMEDLRPSLAKLLRPLGIELSARREVAGAEGADGGGGAEGELAAADRGALTAAAQRRLERQKRRSGPTGTGG